MLERLFALFLLVIIHRQSLERLAWWLAFHLRLGFRWCFLYVPMAKRRHAVEEKVSWIGSAVSVLVQPSKDESVCARDATAERDSLGRRGCCD